MSAQSTRESVAYAAAALRDQQRQQLQNEAAASSTAAAAAAAGSHAMAATALPVPRIPTSAERAELSQLLDLISKCSSKPAATADTEFARLLPHVKQFLRGHDELAPLCVEMLLARLRDPSAAVRISLVRVVDALFLRSKAFRASLLDHMQTFLLLAVGIGPGAGAGASNQVQEPKPPAKAKELQLLSVSSVRGWDATFGGAIQRLRLAVDFIQARLGGMHVPSQLESEHATEVRRAAQRQRTQRLLAVRFARLSSEFESQEREIKRVRREIEAALDLLFPDSTAQADKEQLQDYMLRGTNAGSASPAAAEARPAKRVKRSDSSVSAVAAAAAAHSEPAAVDVAPACAENDDIEWEEDALPPPAIGPAASIPSSSTAIQSAATASTPAVPSEASAPATSAASAPPLEGAAAVFGEFVAADASWWLEELGREEALAQNTGHDEGDHEVDEQADDGNAAAAAAVAHVDRDYSLHIEFDASALAASEDGGGEGDGDSSSVLEALRDGWTLMQKQLLPVLNEWIDCLTRVEFEQSDVVARASGGGTVALDSEVNLAARLAALRRQRDSFLRRAVSEREAVLLLRTKCERLGVIVPSELAAVRSDVVRRETERSIISTDEQANEARGRARHRADAAAAAAQDSASHTRHAAELLRRRADAEQRATKKIRDVKRKYAKTLETERAAARERQATTGILQQPPADPLRRAFRSRPAAASSSNAAAASDAASHVKAEAEGELL